MKKVLRSTLFVTLLLCLLALGASAQKIDRVVFFGDSLSDAGNHFIYTGVSAHQPFSFEPPDFSYDIGGHHFSNGNTWAEQLATSLKTPNSGNPSLRAPGVFTNYAVGRARARAGAPLFSEFDLTTQVNRFLSDFGGSVPDNTLVVIWIGANDVDDAINALFVDQSGQTSAGIIQAAVTSVVTNVNVLYGAGARMFLVANVPDFGATPYVRYLGSAISPVIPQYATALTIGYDTALAQYGAAQFLLPPDAGHPLQFVRVFDVNALFGQILNTPEFFGISNAADRCTTAGTFGNAICSTPNRYLFWDGIHPTTTTHSVIAAAALQQLPPQ
jgi:phospholipase/lecithinase/hemolysin